MVLSAQAQKPGSRRRHLRLFGRSLSSLDLRRFLLTDSSQLEQKQARSKPPQLHSPDRPGALLQQTVSVPARVVETLKGSDYRTHESATQKE